VTFPESGIGIGKQQQAGSHEVREDGQKFD
jgi:hypothetical protein